MKKLFKKMNLHRLLLFKYRKGIFLISGGSSYDIMFEIIAKLGKKFCVFSYNHDFEGNKQIQRLGYIPLEDHHLFISTLEDAFEKNMDIIFDEISFEHINYDNVKYLKYILKDSPVRIFIIMKSSQLVYNMGIEAIDLMTFNKKMI